MRAGLGSPGFLPAGLIVLETTGRRSGQPHRTPLLATVASGGYLWVSTILGRRANWLRNAEAHPDVRYWRGGKVHQGHALVSLPGEPLPDLGALPAFLREKAKHAMRLSQTLGFGAMIIVPDAGRPST